MSVVDEPRELLRAAEQLVECTEVEPWRGLREPHGCPIAAEPPLRRVVADAGSDRVAHHVNDRVDEVLVAPALLGVRTVLEEVRLPLVPAIRLSRMGAVHQLEAP